MQNQQTNRHHKNCISYIFIYAIIGVMSGLIFDALVTYLLAVSPDTVKSMASYMGLATFSASFISLLAPKVGFKKIITIAAAVTAASLLLIFYTKNQWLISAGILLVITSTTIYDVMLSPFIAANTTSNNRADYFTKAFFASVFGMIVGTSIGGPLIVWIFASNLNLPYHEAMMLTKSLNNLNIEQYTNYINSHRTILVLFAAISLLIIIPGLRIKELPEDYSAEASSIPEGRKNYFVLVNKYIMLFMFYIILSRFSGSLIVPQLSIYLTNIGINRVTVSILGTLQYISILVFMVFSTKIVQKIGQVYTIAALYLASVPFMIVLANGYSYGSNVELIVGAALFFRAGLVNAATPLINTLTMELVAKNYRSLYSSVIFVMQSLSQILAGLFAKFYLLKQNSGYADAYYYAAALYIFANIALVTFFTKKYNHSQPLKLDT